MQINNEHQKYKYPNALKSVNFKGQTIPIKQITDKGLKIASGAIASLGLASIAINNKQIGNNSIDTDVSLEDIISSLKEKLPEETFNKVLEKNDVNYLQKLYYLSVIKGLGRDGRKISIIPNYKLPDLINNDIDLDDTIELAQMTYEDENGIKKIRWNDFDILKIFEDNIDIKSEEFKKLSSLMRNDATLCTTGYYYGDENNGYSGKAHLAPMFSVFGIKEVLESGVDVHSSKFNDVVNAVAIDSQGNAYHPFLYVTKWLLDYVKSDVNLDNAIKLKQVYYHTTDGKQYPYFSSPEEIIELSKRDNIDSLIDICNMRIQNNETGIVHSRFSHSPIELLIESGVDFKLAKEIATSELKDEYNRTIHNPSMDDILERAIALEKKEKDIIKDIENIEDTTFRKILNNKFNSIESYPYEKRLEVLEEFKNLIDVYNNFTKSYATFKPLDGNTPKFIKFYNYCKKENLTMTQQEYDDFQELQRLELLISYCNKNNDEASNYLYEEKYINSLNVSDGTKYLLFDINRKFGTKIFVPTGYEDTRAIEYIERELYNWKNVSNNQAKYPPTIDLLRTKDIYMDATSAYGGRSAGCCNEKTGAIEIDGYYMVKCMLRHEMMHSNDLKYLKRFPDDWYEADGKTVKQTVKIKYKNLLREGATGLREDNHLNYAFNNPKEFIAVAGEGNIRHYSPELINLLIEFGMPSWAKNLEVVY